MRGWLPRSIGLALALAALSPLHAVTLLDDPFTDGSRSNTSGGDTLGGVWFQSGTTGTAVSVVDDAAGIGTGNALQLAPTGDFHKLLAFFPTATLANAGDTIRLRFDYRFPTAPAGAGSGFRLGLGHSAGTRQTSDGNGGTPGRRTDDVNYGFDTNVGLTSATATGLRHENAGDDILSGNSPGARIMFGTGGGSVASGTAKHTATLQLTRFPNGDLFATAQIDDLVAASGTHAAAAVLTYTFDEFAFGFGGTGYGPTILVDNVQITTSTLSVLNIAATDATASKAGADPGTFTVTRSSTSGALSVPFAVSGTATGGVDYQALGGVVEFADGQASATITVTPIVGPAWTEGSRTVIVTLSPPAGTLAQTSAATVTITDAFTAVDGQIEPEFSELYTFHLTADGARLWIDDRLIVARTLVQSGEVRGQARLVAGQRANYRLEHIGPTAPVLEWSSPSRPRQVVPAARISPNRVAKAGGTILKEHWSGIAGAALGALTSSANYPDKPGGREMLTAFECLAQDWADSYGTRVTGFLVPPASGSYTFAVSGDDTVELYLSTDADPGNKSLIAVVAEATAFRQWNAQPAQQSAPVVLVQGQRYAVELRHKEDTGTDHWSVGWKKPGDAGFSVIPGSALVPAGLDRAQPAQAAFFDSLAQDHPRLFATAERFAWLKAIYLSPAASKPKTWASSAITSANTILGQPPVVYDPDVRGTILETSRTVVNRMYALGLAWWLTGNNAYADRAWTELNTVADDAAFPDWHPGHFLDTAEMTHACAIGYDWFYHYWTPAQRDTIRTAIVNKGLTAGLTQYNNNVGWSRPTGNNWNQVCNGGLSLGALALGTDSESIAAEILHRATNSLRPVMTRYTTDAGGWYEGGGYWGYANQYLMKHLAGLESALGSDFGLSATRFFSETGFHPPAMSGPTGLAFNFFDSGTGRIQEDALQWLARRFNQPLYAWYENTYGSGVLDALWWQDAPVSFAAAGVSPDFAFHGEAGTPFRPMEAVTLRSNWTDTRATFLGAKGGWMGADHGNFDAGTFVLDALGKRWFHDLGMDDYALPGFFSMTPNPNGIDRWDYYRTRAEGQNTLVVDPGAGPDMIYSTVSPLLAYQSSPGGRRSLSIFDLTPSTAGVTRLWRGLQLLGNRNEVLVQDEIVAPSGRTVWWFAHYTHPATSVTIEPDGTAALLTQGAERLWVKIVSGGDTFQIMDAAPLPTSPNPAGQNANTGFKKLAIALANVTNTTLAVWMVPLAPGENPPATLPTITPLSTWNLAAGNDAPVTPDAVATTLADQPVDIDLRNYATDDATHPGALAFAVGNAVNGTVALLADGHTARFTPAAGYTGVPAFTYTATDAGGLSATGTFTIAAATTTQVWTAPTSGVWSEAGNWSTVTPPQSSRGATLEFFTGQTLAANVTATNDTGAFQLNVLTLAGTASAASTAAISGGALTLTNNGPANPVVNLSATAGSGFGYEIGTPLTLAAPTTFQGNGTGAFRFTGDIAGAGALTKNGSGTLILTGTNSYAGTTTVGSGTLQIGAGGATGTLGAGAVTNNATLRLFRGDTGAVFTNAIGGTGALQLGATGVGGGSAIQTLAGANTFTGGVTVHSGGVRIRDAAALGSGTKTISMANGNITGGTPNPHLRLDGSAGSIDLPATLSFTVSNSAPGNGAFLNEAGHNIVRGNVTVTSGNGDTFLLAAAGSLTFAGDFAPNTTGRTLYLRGAATGVIAGAIRNGTGSNIFTSVRKEDAGTWTLSGAVHHTGTLLANNGTLFLDGTVDGPSAVTVAAAAKLGGRGTIAANTTINGTHLPGGSVGTQTFSGTLTYASGSRLAWELAANSSSGAGTNFDLVDAAAVTIATSGTQPWLDVTLHSPGSSVDFTDPFWAQSRTWPVLTTTSLTGSFRLGTVSTDAAGRAAAGFGVFSLQHTAAGVNLLWTPAPPFQQWQAAFFGANWNNPAIAGDQTDPDRDGLWNLLEYVLPGADPNLANTGVAPALLKSVNGRLALRFDRLPRTDVTLTVLAADTPGGTWDIAATSVGGAAFTAAEHFEVIETGATVEVRDRYLLADPAHPRRFLRLQVTRP